MAGNNGATTFLDTCPNTTNTMTAVSATVDTGNQIGGLNCADVAAYSSPPPYAQISCPLTLGSNLDFFSTNVDFTIEGYFYVPGTNNANALLDFGGNGTGNWGITALLLSNQIDVRGPQTTSWSGINSSPSAFPNATWTHFAIQRASGTGSVYCNGSRIGTAANWNTTLSPYSSAVARFGAVSAVLSTSSQNISIADIKVTRGLARYSGSSYTPAVPLTSGFLSPPNVVNSTLASALTALSSAGLMTTIQQAYHPTIVYGSVISQNPAPTQAVSVGSNVILSLSQGPAPVAGMGGDLWGASGGGQVAASDVTLIGQSLAYAQAQANAVYVANSSVLASISSGLLSLSQATPAYLVPTTPTMG